MEISPTNFSVTEIRFWRSGETSFKEFQWRGSLRNILLFLRVKIVYQSNLLNQI